ncbi:MAG TPA: alkaline phosphatase family protein [Kofleriaceae bacterium]|nr:alkaline phosphatase family protein [Kofleriaceae bacterium]
MGRLAIVLLCACGSSPHRNPGSCDGPCPASSIDHVVIIIQENHTFDSYFAHYCTAAPGSAPTCASGPGCCEAGPVTDPSGATPVVLDDAANAAYDPDHTQGCELEEADGGAMDRYVTGAPSCSDPRNFAYADPAVVQPYYELATAGALADHYFQPISGQSSSNDMYLARAQFVFLDDDYKPDAIGQNCSFIPTAMSFTGPTIGDLLTGAGVSWAFYAEGYQAMVTASAKTMCPKAPPDCAFGIGVYPCGFDPSDDPFDYYPNLADNPKVLRDYTKLASDLSSLRLPQVVYVKGLGYHTEHPGQGTTISDGATFVGEVIDAVQASQYAPDTLILVTWDEGGGYFDHVAPPGPGAVDGEPYGTRVPLLAIGPFAATGTISHVQLEHSSIVSFLEWNWLGMATGQLAGRDATVANLGSLLDAGATGTAVPP